MSDNNKICYKVAILKDGTERLYNRTEWNKKYYENVFNAYGIWLKDGHYRRYYPN